MTSLQLNILNDSAITFAGVSCRRCGGTGELPRFGHVLHGVCFKCNGAGRELTKAGRAAYATYAALLAEATVTKPGWQVEIGDRIEMRRPGCFETVINVRFDSRTGCVVNGICEGSVMITTDERPTWTEARALDGEITLEPTTDILERIRVEVKRRHRKGAQ